MNPAFVNVERPAAEGVGAGKGGYWRVSEDVCFGVNRIADEQKTTSHRGRAKKPRGGTRSSTRNGNAHYLASMQSEFMSSPTQHEFYSSLRHARASYVQPHTRHAAFTQAIPPGPFANKMQPPLPNDHRHGYGFATPAPPPIDGAAGGGPKAGRTTQLPARRQPPRAKKTRLAEPAAGEVDEAEVIAPQTMEVEPVAGISHVPSTPASAPAFSQPSSSRSSLHSAPSGLLANDPSVSSGPTPATEWRAPPSPSPVRYPGLTLQRQESFVRGSGPSRDSPGKLPTPPSERSTLRSGGESVYGLSEHFSNSMRAERDHQPPKLPGIAALLGPLSPSSSLSVTPPHPV